MNRKEVFSIRADIKIGDIYEDCNYDYVLCTEVDGSYWDTPFWWVKKILKRPYDDVSIYGVSLTDGSYGHGCDLDHCGVVKISPEQVEDRAKNTVK